MFRKIETVTYCEVFISYINKINKMTKEAVAKKDPLDEPFWKVALINIIGTAMFVGVLYWARKWLF